MKVLFAVEMVRVDLRWVRFRGMAIRIERLSQCEGVRGSAALVEVKMTRARLRPGRLDVILDPPGNVRGTRTFFYPLARPAKRLAVNALIPEHVDGFDILPDG